MSQPPPTAAGGGSEKVKWNLAQAYDLWTGKGEAKDTPIGNVRYINLARSGKQDKLYRGAAEAEGGEVMGLREASKIAKQILSKPRGEVKIGDKVLTEADKVRFLKSFSKMVNTYSEVEGKIGGVARFILFYQIRQIKAAKDMMKTHAHEFATQERCRIEGKVQPILTDAADLEGTAGHTSMGGDVKALRQKLETLQALVKKREASLQKTETALKNAKDPGVIANLQRELGLKKLNLDAAQKACAKAEKKISEVENMAVTYNVRIQKLRGKLDEIKRLKGELAELQEARKTTQAQDPSSNRLVRLLGGAVKAVRASVPTHQETEVQKQIKDLQNQVQEDVNAIKGSQELRISDDHREQLDNMAEQVAKGKDVDRLEEQDVNMQVSDPDSDMATTIDMIKKKLDSLEEEAATYDSQLAVIKSVDEGFALMEKRKKALDQKAEGLKTLVRYFSEDIAIANQSVTRNARTATDQARRNAEKGTLAQDVEVCKRVAAHTQTIIGALAQESVQLGKDMAQLKAEFQKRKETAGMLFFLDTSVSQLEKEPSGKTRSSKVAQFRKLAGEKLEEIGKLKSQYPGLYAEAVAKYNMIIGRLDKL